VIHCPTISVRLAAAALLLFGVAFAAVAMRDFGTPDDIKTMSVPVLEPRLILSPKSELIERSSRELFPTTLQQVEVLR